ncbi:cytidine deaminase [Variovorax sp. YR266]|uniref:cytidine deaminase n=1 Tax=Variovorax sp. YR266 TaxID=1884386 RepID=UPI001C40AD26|nr:cytidine deaminase [Variovorax sp. YR266]
MGFLDLLTRARDASMNAYAPYSRFAVGAAVETEDGQVFVGANMENASYGVTLCAEAGALQAASTAGQLGKIRRIAIVGGSQHPTEPQQASPISACGRCRQLIAESAQLSGHDIEVICSDLSGTKIKRSRISRLLPDAFDKGRLKN